MYLHTIWLKLPDGQPADQVPAFSGKLSPGNDRKREASSMVMAGT